MEQYLYFQGKAKNKLEIQGGLQAKSELTTVFVSFTEIQPRLFGLHTVYGY